MNFKVIATDFDGTLCENKWPEIGDPNDEIINYLKDQKQRGVKLVLWTCRNNDLLTQAVAWCKERKLEFDAVNQNIKEVIEKYGEDTRKVSADEYIDDLMCTRFKLPFVKKQTGINDEITSFSDEEIKVIETFITKDGPVMEFKEIQALAKMQYEIYKHMMIPTRILKI